MVQWHPLIPFIQVFIHIDQHELTAVQTVFIDHSSQNRELIDGSHRQDQRGCAPGRLTFANGREDCGRHVLSHILLIPAHAHFDRRAAAKLTGGDSQVIRWLPAHPKLTPQSAFGG